MPRSDLLLNVVAPGRGFEELTLHKQASVKAPAHSVKADRTVAEGSRPRIGLFGAAPDTGNMGVSALYESFMDAMRQRLPDAEFVVFDNGLGQGVVTAGDHRPAVYRCGVRVGKRFHRKENLHTMALVARVPWLAKRHSTLASILSCDVLMDVSGGDSFSDIYGRKRFQSTFLSKVTTLTLGKPLVLLPQTYGPYLDAATERQARDIVLCADQVWARDLRSFEALKALAGTQFDRARHRVGVDMAFGLAAAAPPEGSYAAFMNLKKKAEKVIGINVSGLIWNDPDAARSRYGLRADYREVIIQFVQWALSQKDVSVLLVPHVHGNRNPLDSDYNACVEVRSIAIGKGSSSDGIGILTEPLSAAEVKGIISKCDWFMGTRMHATIAALSVGLPTASLVYSDKAFGVFETAGQPEGVVDPRRLSTGEALKALQQHFQANFGAGKGRMSDRRPVSELRRILASQMDELADFALQAAAPGVRL